MGIGPVDLWVSVVRGCLQVGKWSIGRGIKADKSVHTWGNTGGRQGRVASSGR